MKKVKFQRGEEFGGKSSLSCLLEPPGEPLQQRHDDGNFNSERLSPCAIGHVGSQHRPSTMEKPEINQTESHLEY